MGDGGSSRARTFCLKLKIKIESTYVYARARVKVLTGCRRQRPLRIQSSRFQHTLLRRHTRIQPCYPPAPALNKAHRPTHPPLEAACTDESHLHASNEAQRMSSNKRVETQFIVVLRAN